jgi:bacterial/archaeal transporter family protein
MNTSRAQLGARWFWYSLLTIAGWAAWALLLKLGSLQIPDAPALFLQTLGMLPLALLLLVAGTVRGPQDRRGVVYSLLNGSITGIGILFLLAAYRTGGNTAVVSVTTALYPLVTCALAVCLLRERLTTRQWLGLTLSVAAIVLFAWPGQAGGDSAAVDPAAAGAAAAPLLFAPWLLYTILALACFGIVGFLQKISTDRVSAESALVWLIVGFMLLLPFIYTGPSMFHYPARSIGYVVAGGMLNALGSWALLAAMKNGGKASIVVPMTAVYPLLVCVVAPLLLHEHLTRAQGAGVTLGLAAILLLAS